MPVDRRGSDFRDPDRPRLGAAWSPKAQNKFSNRGYDSYRPSYNSPRKNSSAHGDYRYEGSSSASSHSTIITSPSDVWNAGAGGTTRSMASMSPTTPVRSPVTYAQASNINFGKAPPTAPRGPRALSMLSDADNLKRSPSATFGTGPSAAMRAWGMAQDIASGRSLQSDAEVLPTPKSLSNPSPSRLTRDKVLDDSLMLSMILEHLDYPSLCKCLVVSRAWFDRAASVLWKILDDVGPLYALLPEAKDLEQLDLRRMKRTWHNEQVSPPAATNFNYFLHSYKDV